MLPITAAGEPADFDIKVRQPGGLFLAGNPNPKSKEWKGKEYWQSSLPELRTAYKELCAYCATWIPHSTGSHSVDHFLPKALRSDLAYEWANFRYVSARFNSRKGTKTIIDPHTMTQNLFQIDFATSYIIVDPSITDKVLKKLINRTIEVLKLNDDDALVNERVAYLDLYRKNDISLKYLKDRAPLIAFELIRQGLT